MAQIRVVSDKKSFNFPVTNVNHFRDRHPPGLLGPLTPLDVVHPCQKQNLSFRGNNTLMLHRCLIVFTGNQSCGLKHKVELTQRLCQQTKTSFTLVFILLYYNSHSVDRPNNGTPHRSSHCSEEWAGQLILQKPVCADYSHWHMEPGVAAFTACDRLFQTGLTGSAALCVHSTTRLIAGKTTSELIFILSDG